MVQQRFMVLPLRGVFPALAGPTHPAVELPRRERISGPLRVLSAVDLGIDQPIRVLGVIAGLMCPLTGGSFPTAFPGGLLRTILPIPTIAAMTIQ